MSFRPSRTIFPPARYAEDTNGHDLSTRGRPARPTASALATPNDGGPITATSSPLESPSPLLLPVDSDDQVDKTPAPGSLTQSTGKRAALSRNTSRDSSPAPTEIDDDDTPATKKAKTLRPLDTLDDLGMHTDVQVMDLDDSCNPREESLNKSNHTADLQFFFTSAPPAVGQTKMRMSCVLCR